MSMDAPKVVVVTGASAGVGRAVAHRFAAPGVRLALIARDAEALRQVAGEAQAKGAEARAWPLDVADAAAVLAAADEIARAWGAPDVWVNDAMETVFSPVDRITPEEFRRVTEVTYLGVVHGAMAALKHMKPRDRGVIVQVGSALAYRGIPLQAAYCGAKHAIRGFTDSLRTELLHDGSGVRVSMVQLPAMDTPQFDWARTHMGRRPRPVGRVYAPEEAAGAVLRAAQEGGREYWVARTTLMTILGNLVLPAAMDRYLARAAYESQSTGEPVAADRRDNLAAPVHALHRTHGSFGAEAHRGALVVSGAAVRAGAVAAGAAACLGAGVALGAALRRSGRPEARRRARSAPPSPARSARGN
jgi:NAD(P)-dependent dehydrogenase (short-subunit alcohol dehydrogenase family)